MTSYNQQPQRPSPANQPPEHSLDPNSPQTISQSIHTTTVQTRHSEASHQPAQQTTLPEQKGPSWATPSRSMPAKQHQQEIKATRVPALPARASSKHPPIIPSSQERLPKLPRTRTFLTLYLLLLP